MCCLGRTAPRHRVHRRRLPRVQVRPPASIAAGLWRGAWFLAHQPVWPPRFAGRLARSGLGGRRHFYTVPRALREHDPPDGRTAGGLACDGAGETGFLTADPEFDTPEVLKRYGERFGASADRWCFLTG